MQNLNGKTEEMGQIWPILICVYVSMVLGVAYDTLSLG